MKKFIVVLLVLALILSLYMKRSGPKDNPQSPESQGKMQTEKRVVKTPLMVKVARGEGLWHIAERELGSGSKWVELAEANKIAKPYILRVDQELRIPGKDIENTIDVSVSYTMEQIAEHNDKNSCWFAIEGKVYDVTPFVKSGFHPGKDAILEGCGKDATELFNTRPMGSKTSHSDKARKSLDKYLIGELAK